MIQGVFFDLGGTLYSYAKYPNVLRQLVRDMVDRFQLVVVDELSESFSDASRKADHEFAPQSFYLLVDYFQSIFENFMQSQNRKYSAEDISWFTQELESRVTTELELKPECCEALAKLRAKGLYLSVVSNSDETMLEALINRASLDSMLDHYTSSEAAKSCKPNHVFFEVALNKAKLQPEQVLFVGDSIEQDIKGAHAMGMHTVLISEADMVAPMHIGVETVKPDFHITDLRELMGIVHQLSNSS